ncbi:rhodanese-like domain-containing protein [Prochlorothrix hollandica]|uniref:Rhodanese-related sulfurtransferase n=1 Tax=Prochlorothrix hollandica PCC 9006 = CALU 1027 TaxID=317619 RepID=A0A0M2PZ65_PROHO|nr:rhodanese-like domain-containing protein [Prochlorothrix hollandica]KKJ01445.1 rhodanese-related sulfurtransferase [Prochlorothrix hollandica PCC 9006 = CALU 1027]
MHSWQDIPRISVEALGDRLETLAQTPDSPTPQLIDVREPGEVALVSLPGFTVLPLSQAEQWMGTIGDRLDPHQETIVMCHHGGRSAQMCQWLLSQGFTDVKNLVGGIDAYAVVVDPSLPRY